MNKNISSNKPQNKQKVFKKWATTLNLLDKWKKFEKLTKG